jgi:tetratricopeptide (TPR) repeat protein
VRKTLAVGVAVAVALGAVVAIVAARNGGVGQSSAAREPGLSAAFCLSTEFLPYSKENRQMRYPLVRELGRQAVLIAARDGLSLSTRDESLGEAFPEKASVSAVLDIQIRGTNDGRCTISLQSRPTDAEVAVEDVELDHELHFQPNTHVMYASLAAQLAKAARSDLVTSLEDAGFEGVAVEYSDDAPLPEEVEPRLERMAFTDQFAALRQIHDAIALEGESPARLGGLVRGYANLATLTGHYWSTVDAACAARALLYAERLIEVSKGSQDAYWHRAYARALVGLHRLALEDVERAKALNSRESDESPHWQAVVEPYCRFDNDALATLAKDPGLTQLAPYLAFRSKATFIDERWNVDAGRAAAKACPQAFDVYAEMTGNTPMLIQRTAARHMAEALGDLVPRSVAHMDKLPQSALELLAEVNRPSKSWIAQIREGAQESRAFSPLPKQIADALRGEAVNAADRTEPSWQMLANLIAEEQFVQATAHLALSMNAVEHSKADLVNTLSPLVEGHRYAPYVASYAIDKHRQPTEHAALFSTMQVDDPRCNMYWMISQSWTSHDAAGHSYGDLYSEATWQRDYRLPTVVESLRHVNDEWLKSRGLAGHFQRLVEDTTSISPHAPTVLCLEIDTTSNPTREQLADWEKRAKDNPALLRKIAALHNRNRDFEPAIRCYERAYELSPAADDSIALATAYRNNGQEDKWLPTLERYLTEEDYALGHAMVHQKIAEHYMNKGKWNDAEPHALEAAQTYSAWGLVLASRVYEGLGQWEESEKWVREASTNYPTYSGMDWYLWCRRTGRGDEAEAKKIADEFLKLNWVANQDRGVEYLFVDDMLHGRHEQALKRLQEAPESIANEAYWRTHVVMLAKRLGQDDVYQAEMARLVEMADAQYKTSDPTYHALLTLLYNHRDDKSLSKEALARAEEMIDKFDAYGRCNYDYFLGEFLALMGDEEAAEKYWRRAIERGPFDKYNATLAGARLAEKHGTSRPDDEPPAADRDADSASNAAPNAADREA